MEPKPEKLVPEYFFWDQARKIPRVAGAFLDKNQEPKTKNLALPLI